jgi:hypothetical protein
LPDIFRVIQREEEEKGYVGHMEGKRTVDAKF